MDKSYVAIAVLGGFMLLAPVALAQEVAEEQTSPTSAPDIVRLKNGGIIRGTISELVPGEQVEIITAAGKARSYPMSEVAYAGPASEEPKDEPGIEPSAPSAPAEESPAPAAAADDAARPIVTVKAGESNVEFRTEGAPLTLHRQDSTAVAVGPGGAAVGAGFTEICTSPCAATIASGTHTLALSHKSGQVPTRAEPVTLPEGEVTLTGRIESRAGVRWAGAGLMLVGFAGGTALMLSGIDADDPGMGGEFYGGLVLMSVGAIAGTLMLMTPNKAHLQMSRAQPTLHEGRLRRLRF